MRNLRSLHLSFTINYLPQIFSLFLWGVAFFFLIHGRFLSTQDISLLVVQSWLLATPWTAAHEAPQSTRFLRQEQWSGMPFPSPSLLPTVQRQQIFPRLSFDFGIFASTSLHFNVVKIINSSFSDFGIASLHKTIPSPLQEYKTIHMYFLLALNLTKSTQNLSRYKSVPTAYTDQSIFLPSFHVLHLSYIGLHFWALFH